MAHPTGRTGHRTAGSRRSVLQQPDLHGQQGAGQALEELAALPPLVTSWEVEHLKREELARAQQGEAFVLQGGDCAESFVECTSPRIVAQLKILLQMSVVLTAGLKQPVIRIGRMAGQYAKPRSADTEHRDGTELPSYRGDLVNRHSLQPSDREPDPRLLLRGYERAALTLNFVRSLIAGGFADLHHPENWDLDFVSHSRFGREVSPHRAARRGRARFLRVTSRRTKIHEARRVDFFASHEGLHLLYEQAQTRYLEHRGAWYDLTTHLPWIGMRTADPEGAHVEFFRGVANPIGVKVRRRDGQRYTAGVARAPEPGQSARAPGPDPPARGRTGRAGPPAADRGRARQWHRRAVDL